MKCLIQKKHEIHGVDIDQYDFPFYLEVLEASEITVSLVILALKDFAKLSALLHSIPTHPQGFYEIIILDYGCEPQTAHLIIDVFPKTIDRMHLKYSRQCGPKERAAVNDLVVDMAAKTSKWILFLDENIILQGSTFVNELLELGESQPNAGAVGCKLLNRYGRKIVEAGNIIWSDGSTTRFGFGQTNVDSSEFSYPRTVDYMSASCLMVKKNILFNYEGFHTHYVNDDYQVIDLQMYIQYELGKDVWYQPQSVAFYDDNMAPIDTNEMPLVNSRIFSQEKLKKILTNYSLPPNKLSDDEKELALLRASDHRSRDSSSINILYIDEQIPNVSMGAGYGRAFGNLMMLASLGYKITVIGLSVRDDICDKKCIRRMTDHSIEVATGDWEEYLEQRGSLYEVIIVSRPTTFQETHKKLRELYKNSPFALIFDSEALWHRRDEMLIRLCEKGINFPSIDTHFSTHFWGDTIEKMKHSTEKKKKDELKLYSMADTVVTVSEGESDVIKTLFPNGEVEIVGHLNANMQPQPGFHEREGILFLASFFGSMYYNGDAIWYFLKEIYPLVLDEAPSPIHLTIAGRQIPNEIRKFTKKNGLDQFVKFIDSPKSVVTLYKKARIFIAPHLYGAGVQFKLSEAFNYGIPTVMSQFSATSFKISEESDISCVGKDVQSFKKCIIDVYNNKMKWDRIRMNGFTFVNETHNKTVFLRTWSKLIENGKKMFNKRKAERTKTSCVEGEELYKRKHPEVTNHIKRGFFDLIYGLWKGQGKIERRNYLCEDKVHPLFTVDK